jgi:hypothetical protein
MAEIKGFQAEQELVAPVETLGSVVDSDRDEVPQGLCAIRSCQ